MFLQVCVILFTGGVPDQVLPPRTRYPPGTRYSPPPPQTRYTPSGPGTPPRTRYTPPGPDTPPHGPGTPPQDQAPPHGPGTPPGPGNPPIGPGTPPPREIRSTCGRYASYWNAFLLGINYCVNYRRKWVHNPLLNCSVQAKVDQITSVNVSTEYTHCFANSSCNSSRLTHSKCKWTQRPIHIK